MDKPLIGINFDIVAGPPRKAVLQAFYYESVLKAGGIPVPLVPMPVEDLHDVLRRLNGLLLTGGPDYEPSSYGENSCEQVELVHPDRQTFDMQLVAAAVNGDQPVLGICAGCQLLNIGLGGSLIQDIPSHLPNSTVVHTSKNGWTEGFTKHNVRIEAPSKLSALYANKELAVPTSHHQSVKALGKGLKATAYAEDGIIEAVELDGKPFVIGVQWHPERDYEGNRTLFEEFIKQASKSTATTGRNK